MIHKLYSLLKEYTKLNPNYEKHISILSELVNTSLAIDVKADTQCNANYDYLKNIQKICSNNEIDLLQHSEEIYHNSLAIYLANSKTALLRK